MTYSARRVTVVRVSEPTDHEVDAAFLAFDADPSAEHESELRKVLQAAGWSAERIERALTGTS